MVFNTVSEAETPPQTSAPPPLPSPPPPPPPPPPPQQLPVASSGFSEKSQPNSSFSFSSLRYSLNHSYPNRSNHSPLPYPQSRLGGNWALRHGDSGLNPVPQLGSSGGLVLNPASRLNSAGWGLNPVLRLGPSSPKQTESKNSEPGLGDSDLSVPVRDDGERPVRVLDKKVSDKGKSKVPTQFTGKNKGSGSEPETEADSEAEAESSEDEEQNFAKDGEPPFVKTWNLRPRPKPPVVNNGGGSRNGGQSSVQANRPKPAQAPARPRPRVGAGPAAQEERAVPKKLTFSLTLTKEEIEEDFLKMTGAKPPKKPKKRAKNVQKQLDGTFPGMFLGNVNPDLYRVPDPPLKN